MKPKQNQDQRYLNALKDGNRKVIEEIYADLSPIVCKHVIANNGTFADANDIFQDTIMTLILLLAKDKLNLSGPFKNYFLAICRNKWLNRLKKREIAKNKSPTEDWVIEWHLSEDIDGEELEWKLRQETKYELYREKFDQLPPYCREILRLSMKLNQEHKKAYSLMEVAEILGKSYPYIRKAKTNCLKTLKKAIREDIRFQDLINQ